MKYLMIMLLLSGCSNKGYFIRSHQIYQATILVFECTKENGFMLDDHVIAICNTKEECNKICEDKRNQK